MLLTLSNPVKSDFEFKPHAYSPAFSSSTAARYSDKPHGGFPSQAANPHHTMGSQHRGLPPPSAMTLPDPGRGPPPMSSSLGQLPPAPTQWQGAEDGMKNWLAAKAEEERRKQEEEKTRQETLRLEQRKVEQSMLRESMQGGVPPHLVPIIFAGIGGGNLANTVHDSSAGSSSTSSGSGTSTAFSRSSKRPKDDWTATVNSVRGPGTTIANDSSPYGSPARSTSTCATATCSKWFRWRTTITTFEGRTSWSWWRSDIRCPFSSSVTAPSVDYERDEHPATSCGSSRSPATAIDADTTTGASLSLDLFPSLGAAIIIVTTREEFKWEPASHAIR
jgi:hypothetical protein